MQLQRAPSPSEFELTPRRIWGVYFIAFALDEKRDESSGRRLQLRGFSSSGARELREGGTDPVCG